MHESFNMQEFLGLSDREMTLMRTKWSLINVINLMIEDAGIDEAALAIATGSSPAQVSRWLHGIVRDVTLDDLDG